MNKKKREGFSQVCVWPSCLVGAEKVQDFEQIMKENFDVRVQYLEEIETFPDKDELGRDIEGTGGRNDLFFTIHNDDVGSFALKRLSCGIRWIEDVLSDCNYNQRIYPDRVFEYKTW